MRHELKIWPQYYCRVADGTKTFEVRENDRGFQYGDIVILKEWDPEPENPNAAKHQARGFTESRPLEFQVGYVFQLDSSRVVFSLLPTKKPKG
jgi:hypothetical protein